MARRAAAARSVAAGRLLLLVCCCGGDDTTEQLLETAQQLEGDVVAELRGWPAMHSAVLRALRAAAAFPPPPTDRQWTCLESAETKLRLLASSSTGLTQPVWAREGHQLGEFLEANALQMGSRGGSLLGVLA